jgi:hypothetical protein
MQIADYSSACEKGPITMHFPAEALTALVVLQPESQLLDFSHPAVVVLSLTTVLVLVVTAMRIRRPGVVQTRIQQDVHVAEHNPELEYGRESSQ